MADKAKKRILFVDDEPPVLNLLQVLCRQADPNWEPLFVPSGAVAVQCMAEKPIDAVVSDMRMPGMNGAELLEHIRDHSPRTFRAVLSGYMDQPLAEYLKLLRVDPQRLNRWRQSGADE